jgi:Flp pilus assembly pilin Flp
MLLASSRLTPGAPAAIYAQIGENIMNSIRKLYVKADQFSRGQTMTEYALILAAVAVVVFAFYQTMGSDIGVMITNIDNLL